MHHVRPPQQLLPLSYPSRTNKHSTSVMGHAYLVKICRVQTRDKVSGCAFNLWILLMIIGFTGVGRWLMQRSVGPFVSQRIKLIPKLSVKMKERKNDLFLKETNNFCTTSKKFYKPVDLKKENKINSILIHRKSPICSQQYCFFMVNCKLVINCTINIVNII